MGPKSGQLASRSETSDDQAFSAELTRQVHEDRRTSRPRPQLRSAPESMVEPDESTPSASSEGAANDNKSPSEGARSASGDATDLQMPTGLNLYLESSALPFESGALVTGGTAMGSASVTSPAGTAPAPESVAHPEQVPAAPFAKVVASPDEQQINLRKLTKYLVNQTAEGAARKPETDRQTPALEPRPPPDAAPPSTEPAPKPLERGSSGLETSMLSTSSSASSTDGKPGSDLGPPFDAAARFASPVTNEAQAPPRAPQLSEAAQRALSEARQKMMQPGRIQDGQLSMTLTVEEASIPMRLRFSPDGNGGQTVAFLVSSAKDLRELKRLMPEIETVLTEFPVGVSDVQVDIDSFRDEPSENRPGELK